MLHNERMKCPQCNSTSYRKNGYRRGKQCYQCRSCGRQFVESPIPKSYPFEVKQLCLKMYLNGMGLRGIERVTEIHHTTIMNWIEEAGMELPDTPEEGEIPEITEIDGEGRWGFPSLSNRHVDELQTFIGKKKNKVWIWTMVNHWQPGILLWTVGVRSSETFKHLWSLIKCWHSFWYVSDGYPVYPGFIAPEDHLVSKTYMTRVQRRLVRRM